MEKDAELQICRIPTDDVTSSHKEKSISPRNANRDHVPSQHMDGAARNVDRVHPTRWDRFFPARFATYAPEGHGATLVARRRPGKIDPGRLFQS